MISALLTGYDDAMSYIGDLTSPLMDRYARLHGMEYKCRRLFGDVAPRLEWQEYVDGSHPAWQKIRVVIEAFNDGAGMVMWLDADSVITNPSLEWRSKQSGLHVSRDWGIEGKASDFSTGNFVAYADTLPLWEEAALRGPEWAHEPLYEQSAVVEMYEELAWVHNLVHIYPRRVLNSVPIEAGFEAVAEPWQPGDFLCHLTNMPSREARVQKFFELTTK